MRHRKPSKQKYDFSRIEHQLNTDVFSQVLQFLPHQEEVSLASSNNFFKNSASKNQLFRKKQLFMELVSHGNEDGVREKISNQLEEVNTRSPLSYKINFVDYAQRNFHNITAVKLAIFYLDFQMHDLLAEHIGAEEIEKQKREIEEQGIDYTIPRKAFDRLSKEIAPNIIPPLKNNFLDPDSKDPVLLNEKHYDWCFRVLEVALEKFISAARLMHQRGKYTKKELEELDKLWSDVGFAQRYIPPPFINAYCSLDLRRQPDGQFPNFDNIKRNYRFFNWVSSDYHNWFAAFDLVVLEENLGILGRSWRAGIEGGCGVALGTGAPAACAENLAALRALFETRTNNYENFNELVLVADRSIALRVR